MRRSLLPLLLAALAALALAGCRRGPTAPVVPAAGGFPVTVRDSLKRDVTIPARPRRIVSTAPAVTEILFAIGAGDRVVADTKYCTYPPEAAKLPHIGDFLNPNPELIAAMNPDLIIVMAGNQMAVVESLKTLGAPVVALADPKDLAGATAAIELLGRATGMDAEATAVVTAMRARTAAVEQDVAGLPASARPRVLYLISPDLYSVGPGTVVDDMITRAGGTNIAASAGKPWPQLSMETVIAADPQVIVMSPEPSAKGTWDSAEHALALLRKDPRWAALSAVKNGRVFAIDSGLVQIPGPRLVDGLEAMRAAIQTPAGGKP